MQRLELPPIEIFTQDKFHRNYGWSDHYGAFYVAAQYCNHNINKPTRVHWLHGCLGPWDNVDPYFILGSFKKNKKYYVATKEQELYLINSGFSKVQAIGLPIVYLDETKYERIPKSLLIMPPHILRGMSFLDADFFRKYIEYIKEYIPLFDFVAVCLHNACFETGLWVNEFKELGVEIIRGAQTNDKNALIRQKALFSQFETVTTSGWGSHVAYALFFGAKVSIYGPHSEIRPEDLIRYDTFYKNNPTIANTYLSEQYHKEKNNWINHLCAPPNKSVKDENLGKYLVGFENKLTPAELFKLFFTKKIYNSIVFFFWRLNSDISKKRITTIFFLNNLKKLYRNKLRAVKKKININK